VFFAEKGLGPLGVKIRKTIFKKHEKYVQCIHLKKEGTLGRKSIEFFSKYEN